MMKQAVPLTERGGLKSGSVDLSRGILMARWAQFQRRQLMSAGRSQLRRSANDLERNDSVAQQPAAARCCGSSVTAMFMPI
jgi:hypothetical protein